MAAKLDRADAQLAPADAPAAYSDAFEVTPAGAAALLDVAPRDPRTPTEWQEAVDTAELLLRIETSRLYGLLEGGPEIRIERCEDILHAGRRRGFVPKV